jgi:SAM-dependent methyltransferase
MAERDYVLGTHDAEIERLGLQHRLWRPLMLEGWRRAGVCEGQTVLDIGAGPGYAALDLADIVGGRGRVLALERSARFLEALKARAAAQGLTQVTTRELDLVKDEFGITAADAAWCRWVLCFVSDPRAVIRRIHAALRPAGVAVFHEYIDYRAWRFAPRLPLQERFVEAVMSSWEAEGGRPDVGGDLPEWLTLAGFRVESTRLMTDIVTPDDPLWQWPRRYVAVGAARLVELGKFSAAEAAELDAAIGAIEQRPQSRMVMPSVVEVIARRDA